METLILWVCLCDMVMLNSMVLFMLIKTRFPRKHREADALGKKGGTAIKKGAPEKAAPGSMDEGFENIMTYSVDRGTKS